MCIRDRHIAVAQTRDGGAHWQDLPDLAPVSYTHLDVYKRQSGYRKSGNLASAKFYEAKAKQLTAQMD